MRASEKVWPPKFCSNASSATKSHSFTILTSLDQVKAGIVKFNERAIADNLCDQFDHFLTECKAEILDSTSLPAGDVLDKYFARRATFQ